MKNKQKFHKKTKSKWINWETDLSPSMMNSSYSLFQSVSQFIHLLFVFLWNFCLFFIYFSFIFHLFIYFMYIFLIHFLYFYSLLIFIFIFIHLFYVYFPYSFSLFLFIADWCNVSLFTFYFFFHFCDDIDNGIKSLSRHNALKNFIFSVNFHSPLFRCTLVYSIFSLIFALITYFYHSSF